MWDLSGFCLTKLLRSVYFWLSYLINNGPFLDHGVYTYRCCLLEHISLYVCWASTISIAHIHLLSHVHTNFSAEYVVIFSVVLELVLINWVVGWLPSLYDFCCCCHCVTHSDDTNVVVKYHSGITDVSRYKSSINGISWSGDCWISYHISCPVIVAQPVIFKH